MTAVVIVAAVVAVTGCGGSDDGDTKTAVATVTTPPDPPLQTLDISAAASGRLRFTPRRLSAKPGRVAILMQNPKPSGKPHGVGLTGVDLNVQGLTVKPGELSEATGEVTAGRYSFYCTVPSHAKAGMRGTLVVR
ncbi:MAG TPA: plastocyanin/azurin family copper-binding protein [Solirubrobacteraceae bacterium]|nr:plastocyanin/azurin family copper-binding protein [Solirubrobacteraceae bacterium]